MASLSLRLARSLRNPWRAFSEAKYGAAKWGQCARSFATEELSDNEDTSGNGDVNEKNFRVPVFQGVYKAVILGEVAQPPSEMVLKSGRSIVNILVATGGMRVNKKPTEGESQKPSQPVKQIHKIVVYQERLKGLATQKIKKGAQVYLEGNMESRVFNDPVTGAVKVVREIAVRQNGRLFLMDDLELRGGNNDDNKPYTPRSRLKKGEEAEEHGGEEAVTAC